MLLSRLSRDLFIQIKLPKLLTTTFFRHDLQKRALSISFPKVSHRISCFLGCFDSSTNVATRSSEYKGSSRTSSQKRSPYTNVSGLNSTQTMACRTPSSSTFSQPPAISAKVTEGSQSPRSPHLPSSTQCAQMSWAAQQYYYPGQEEYIAAVTNGASSIGIEVPANLQQRFVDRHGQFSSLSVAEAAGSGVGIQKTSFTSSSGCHAVPYSYEQVVGYGNGHDERAVDLVGIGAQFGRW